MLNDCRVIDDISLWWGLPDYPRTLDSAVRGTQQTHRKRGSGACQVRVECVNQSQKVSRAGTFSTREAN